jgi:hypothetical protein
VKTTPKPRATKNSRGDCVVELLLLSELAAVDEAKFIELDVAVIGGGVVLVVI